MGSNSNISWCDNTFNPWWGCTKISDGCRFCYAEGQANKQGDWFGADKPRRFFGNKHWNAPMHWNYRAKLAGHMELTFCGSMCDVMEDRDDLNPERTKLFRTVEHTRFLWWLFLTKRPEMYFKYLPEEWMSAPKDNVCVMTTVESQTYVNKAVILSEVPARVRGLSVEPMIGPIVFPDGVLQGIDWVIIGGESGENARPFDPAWGRDLIAQCRENGVAVFVKQFGSNPVGMEPFGRKGEIVDMWPEEFRSFEFPKAFGR